MSCNTQGKLAGSSKAAGPTGLELGSTPDTLTAFCSFTFGFNLMLAMGSKKGCLGSPASESTWLRTELHPCFRPGAYTPWLVLPTLVSSPLRHSDSRLAA